MFLTLPEIGMHLILASAMENGLLRDTWKSSHNLEFAPTDRVPDFVAFPAPLWLRTATALILETGRRHVHAQSSLLLLFQPSKVQYVALQATKPIAHTIPSMLRPGSRNRRLPGAFCRYPPNSHRAQPRIEKPQSGALVPSSIVPYPGCPYKACTPPQNLASLRHPHFNTDFSEW